MPKPTGRPQGCWQSPLPGFWAPPRRPRPPLDGAGAPAGPGRAPPAATLRGCRRPWARTKEGPGRAGGGAAVRRAGGPQGPLQGGAAASRPRAARVEGLGGHGVGAAPPHLPATQPCKEAGGLSSPGGSLGSCSASPSFTKGPRWSWRLEKAGRVPCQLRLLCCSFPDY